MQSVKVRLLFSLLLFSLNIQASSIVLNQTTWNDSLAVFQIDPSERGRIIRYEPRFERLSSNPSFSSEVITEFQEELKQLALIDTNANYQLLLVLSEHGQLSAIHPLTGEIISSIILGTDSDYVMATNTSGNQGGFYIFEPSHHFMHILSWERNTFKKQESYYFPEISKSMSLVSFSKDVNGDECLWFTQNKDQGFQLICINVNKKTLTQYSLGEEAVLSKPILITEFGGEQASAVIVISSPNSLFKVLLDEHSETKSISIDSLNQSHITLKPIVTKNNQGKNVIYWNGYVLTEGELMKVDATSDVIHHFVRGAYYHEIDSLTKTLKRFSRVTHSLIESFPCSIGHTTYNQSGQNVYILYDRKTEEDVIINFSSPGQPDLCRVPLRYLEVVARHEE